VDEEPVLFEQWQRAVALDHAMSGLAGQTPPSPEETLNRLINQRLVLRAAENAGLPKASNAQAEAWLQGFLMSLNQDEAALEQSLVRVGLTRADLVGDLVPHLLDVQRALETLPPDGDREAWVAGLAGEAKVVLLESVPVAELVEPLSPTADENLLASPPPGQARPGARVGEPAPDFNLKTTDGATVQLSDLRGQPVVLNFWAPWCAPCREELPILESIEGDDLVVLGLAVRESRDQVVAFAADLGLELTLLLDLEGQASDDYQVRGLPTTIFVDREGVTVARHVGPLDQQTLDEFLTLLRSKSPPTTPTP
jgi:thiol-disulfide isomerase/thioredoxin